MSERTVDNLEAMRARAEKAEAAMTALYEEVARLRALVERAAVLVAFAQDVPKLESTATAWLDEWSRTTSAQTGEKP